MFRWWSRGSEGETEAVGTDGCLFSVAISTIKLKYTATLVQIEGLKVELTSVVNSWFLKLILQTLKCFDFNFLNIV